MRNQGLHGSGLRDSLSMLTPRDRGWLDVETFFCSLSLPGVVTEIMTEI